jgi:hypothetical protein
MKRQKQMTMTELIQRFSHVEMMLRCIFEEVLTDEQAEIVDKRMRELKQAERSS